MGLIDGQRASIAEKFVTIYSHVLAFSFNNCLQSIRQIHWNNFFSKSDFARHFCLFTQRNLSICTSISNLKPLEPNTKLIPPQVLKYNAKIILKNTSKNVINFANNLKILSTTKRTLLSLEHHLNRENRIKLVFETTFLIY